MSNANKLIKLSNILKFAGQSEKKVQKLLPNIIKDEIFQNKIYISGGYVRDFIKGIQSNDLDLVIQLNGGSKLFCQFLINLFDGYIVYEMLNPFYPTYNIKFKRDIQYDGLNYKIQNASIDISDTSVRRFAEDSGKDKLFIYGNLYQDAMQRDFTINALFKNISNGEILDPTNHGIQDIKNNLLRTIPGINKNRLFYDNPKVMLRYCRFYAKYDMNTVEQDIEYMKINAERILSLDKECIQKELNKLEDSYKYKSIEMMKNIEIYSYLKKYL